MADNPLIDEAVRKTLKEREDARLRESMSFGIDGNPDTRAKAKKISDATGVPVDDVEPQLGEFEKILAKRNFDPTKYAARAPKSAAFLSDPQNASIGWDDHEVLGTIEEAHAAAIRAENARTGNTWYGGLAASLAKGGLNVLALPYTSADAIQHFLTPRSKTNWAEDAFGAFKYAKTASDKLTQYQRALESPLIDDGKGGKVFNPNAVNPTRAAGIETLANVLASEALPMTATFLLAAATAPETGGASIEAAVAANAPKIGKLKMLGEAAIKYASSPAGILNSARVVQGQYEEGVKGYMERHPGVTLEEAKTKVAGGALLAGAVSPLFGGPMELSFMEDMAKLIARSPGGATVGAQALARIRALASGAVKEGMQEGLESIGENLSAWLTYHPDMSLKEASADVFMNAVGGVAMGGTMGGVLGGGQTKNIQAREFFAALADQSKASKLLERDPGSFKKVLETIVKDGPLETVGIPADKFTTYMQSKGEDPAAVAEYLGVRNYDEAVLAGTDIRIPTGEFAAKIAGTEHYAGLSKDLRFQDEPTLREEEEFKSEAQKVLAEHLAEQGKESAKQGEEAQAKADLEALPTPARFVIQERTQAQLEAAGFEPSTAATYARLHAKIVSNMAERAGLDPMALADKYSLTVTRPLVSERASTSLVDRVMGRLNPETGQEYQPEGFFWQGGSTPKTETPEFKRWFGDSKVVDESGNPLVVYHGTTEEFDVFSKAHQGKVTRATSSKNGFFFVDSPRTAQSYADHGATVAPVERLIEAADKAGNRGNWDLYDQKISEAEALEAQFQDPANRMRGQNLKPVFLSIKNPLVIDAKGETPAGIGGIDPFIKQAQKDGHDGVIIKNFDDAAGLANDNATHYIAFKPEQIKSAIGNNGEFDPNNPSILFQNDRRDRARQKMSASLSPSHQAGELNRRANEARTEAEALAAFEEEVKAIQAGNIQGGEARGFIQFGEDHKIQIGLLRDADLSTFIHEVGHFYLEIMGDLAESEGVSQETKDDYAKILKHIGAESRSGIKTEHHENFARSFEAYLWEGKAPSEDMKPIFQRVMGWMRMVYESLKALKIKLSPEVRGVFDRMVATDNEIDAAIHKMGGIKTMFATAEEAGMTDAEFKAYSSLVSKAVAETHEKANAEILADVRREQTEQWENEWKRTREDVAADVAREPGYRAFDALTAGQTLDGIPVKLNKKALLDARITQEELNKLPRKRDRIYSREGGMDLEAAAEILNFASGEELWLVLSNLENREERIDALTDEAMRGKYGDKLLDGQAVEVALEAAHNNTRADLLAAELKILQKKQAEIDPILKARDRSERASARDARDVPPIATFRAVAKELVENSRFRDLEPNKYVNAERMASREAFKAMGQKDYATARAAKERELLNHFLYLEAVKGKRESEKIAEYGRKLGKGPAQARIGLAQNGLLEQVNTILDRVGFDNVSLKELDRRAGMLAAWVDQAKKDGEAITFDPADIERIIQKNYKEMTLSELRATKDALKNLETIARRQTEFDKETLKVAYDAEKARMESVTEGRRTIPLSSTDVKTAFEKIAENASLFHVSLQKIEWIVDKLDQGDINGPFRKMILEPIYQGSAKLDGYWEAITSKINKVIEARPKSDRDRAFESTGVTLPGMARALSYKQAITLMLNLGTAENRHAALLGHQLVTPEGQIIPEMQKLMGMLRKTEWEYIQGVWDVLEGMYPAIKEHHRRTTGVELGKKSLTPFTVKTVDGEEVNMRGGYWPQVVDPDTDTRGRSQAGEGDLAQMFGDSWSSIATAKGHTKDVTGATYKVLLDHEQILTSHLDKVLRDLAYREPAQFVQRVLRDPEISAMIRETVGPEAEKEFYPWLNDTVVGDKLSASDKANPYLRFMLNRRAGLVAAAIAGNVSVAAMQLTDPLKALPLVRPDYLMKAYTEVRLNPEKLIAEIREMSPEVMRYREKNFNRELRQLQESHSAFEDHGQRLEHFAGALMETMDRFNSFPIWYASFLQAQDKGNSKEQAIKIADRDARLILQAGRTQDQSRMFRAGGWTRLLTMFMSEANTYYNMISGMVGRKNAMGVGVALFAAIASRVVGQALAGRFPEDDEEKKKWLLRNSAMALPETVPLLGDISKMLADYADHGRGDFQYSPVMGAFTKAGRALDSGKDYFANDGDGAKAIIDASDLIGTWAGVPGTGQIVKSAKYIDARLKGEVDQDSDAEAAYRIFAGKQPKH